MAGTVMDITLITGLGVMVTEVTTEAGGKINSSITVNLKPKSFKKTDLLFKGFCSNSVDRN